MTPAREDTRLAPFRAFRDAILTSPPMVAMTRLAEWIAEHTRVR